MIHETPSTTRVKIEVEATGRRHVAQDGIPLSDYLAYSCGKIEVSERRGNALRRGTNLTRRSAHMEFIPLRDRKGRILAHSSVDAEDYEWLNQFRWSFNTHLYAQARVQGRMQLMHGVMLNPAAGFEVDHINRCKIDNRRSNLRVVSRSFNTRNRPRQPNNTSGFKGVSWEHGAWVAQTHVKGNHIYLGRHRTALQAAIARKEYLHLHGIFVPPDEVATLQAAIEAAA